MTDIAATMGCDSLNEFNKIINHRKKFITLIYKNFRITKRFNVYMTKSKKKSHGAWLFTILAENKDYLQKN